MSFHIRLQKIRSAIASNRGQRRERRRGVLRSATLPPSLEVLENRYLFSFTPAVIYEVGMSPQAVVTADFNNDGQLDLATANVYDDTVSVLLGNADGTFQPAPTSATGPYPISLVVGDFNGDGQLDMATANQDVFSSSDGHDISILLGNSDGTFAAAIAQSISRPYSWSVATGDLNADGKSDLVVTSDDDGFGGYVNVLLGDGDGTFTAATYGPYFGPSNVNQLLGSALADINGDGKVDVVVTSWQTNSVKVFLGNGNGTLQEPSDFATDPGPNSVAAGDFNGDGKLDLATANYSESVSLLLGNGDGTFQTAQSFAAGDYLGSVTAGDVNSDGKLDLVVSNSRSSLSADGAVSVLLGNGDGSLAPPISTATGGSATYSVVMGDFNGDGRPDAVAANAGSNSVSVLLNDGNWPSTAVPSLSISDATVAEGNTGTASATFKLTLSSTSTVDVTVHYSTADGSAIAGSDYQAKAGTATIAAGQTSTTVAVAIIGDTRKESDETFFMNLSGAVGGSITDGQGVGTILNDDGPPKKMNHHDAALLALNFGRVTDATLEGGDLTDDGRVDLADLAHLQAQLDGSAASPAMPASAVVASAVRQRAVDIPVTRRQTGNATLRAHARKAAATADRGVEQAASVATPSSATLDSLALRAARLRRAFAG